LTALFDDIRTL